VLAAPSPASAHKDSGDDDNNDVGQHAPSRFVSVGTYTAPNTAPGGIQQSTALGIYVFKMASRRFAIDVGTGQISVINDPPCVTTKM